MDYAGTSVSYFHWNVSCTLFIIPIGWSFFFEKTDTTISRFGDMEGNLQLYLWLVTLGWIFGGFLKRLLFRGFLLNRIEQMFGKGRLSTIVAIFFSGRYLWDNPFLLSRSLWCSNHFYGSLLYRALLCAFWMKPVASYPLSRITGHSWFLRRFLRR